MSELPEAEVGRICQWWKAQSTMYQLIQVGCKFLRFFKIILCCYFFGWTKSSHGFCGVCGWCFFGTRSPWNSLNLGQQKVAMSLFLYWFLMFKHLNIFPTKNQKEDTNLKIPKDLRFAFRLPKPWRRSKGLLSPWTWQAVIGIPQWAGSFWMITIIMMLNDCFPNFSDDVNLCQFIHPIWCTYMYIIADGCILEVCSKYPGSGKSPLSTVPWSMVDFRATLKEPPKYIVTVCYKYSKCYVSLCFFTLVVMLFAISYRNISFVFHFGTCCSPFDVA